MSDIEREAFEQWAWKYADDEDAWEDMGRDEIFIAGMQADRQAPASVEPVAYMFSDEYGRTKIMLGKETAEHWCPPDETVTPLYAHPPAKVPEGFEVMRRPEGIMVTRLSDGGSAFYEKESPLVTQVMAYHFLDALLTTPTTATTPETEWVKCEDRLPTEDDADFAGWVWAYWHKDPEPDLWKVHAVRSHRFTAWKPTGLKRPTPPQEQRA